MKLQELPLLMEGFHQVKLDAGGPPGWYINRWADIPEEWEAEFKYVETVLARVAGKTIAELVKGKKHHLLDPDIGLDEMALNHVYMGMVEGILPESDQMAVNALLNEFFDGAEDSRHQRLNDLFVTDQYSY